MDKNLYASNMFAIIIPFDSTISHKCCWKFSKLNAKCQSNRRIKVSLTTRRLWTSCRSYQRDPVILTTYEKHRFVEPHIIVAMSFLPHWEISCLSVRFPVISKMMTINIQLTVPGSPAVFEKKKKKERKERMEVNCCKDNYCSYLWCR